jgi:Rrf2 family iron-sulfur cluster assembly transcriptional regulator
MKMSTKGRYAVMAMIDIGEHSGGQPVSLAEIAERQNISQEYRNSSSASCARRDWWTARVAPAAAIGWPATPAKLP